MSTYSHFVRFFCRFTLAALAEVGIAHANDYAEIERLLQTGKAAEAQVKTAQRLFANPQDPQLRFLLGVAQADSGKHTDAISTFSKLTEEYPDLPEPYNNLAVMYAGRNQFDKALAALEVAIHTNPSYAKAHENLGDIYAMLASRAYGKALQFEGVDTDRVKLKLVLIRELASLVSKANPGNRRSFASKPVEKPPTLVTPVVEPVPAVTSSAPKTVPESEVVQSIQSWASAWQNQELGRYLGAYSDKFVPANGQTLSAWERIRRERIVGRAKIEVVLSELRVTVKGSAATANFRQRYSSGSHVTNSLKRLDLVMSTGGRWVIVREAVGE